MRKQSKKYYFTVEGETEQWYLEWLKKKINETESAKYKVTFDCPIQKNPLKRAKSLVTTGKTEVWHISDYESNEPYHREEFRSTMDNMKKAQELGKQISYKFGYSNFTFDLWIILHKADCMASFTDRSQYKYEINNAYDEKFEDMKDYKHENNFKRCLRKLQLSDVIKAISRAKIIMQNNKNCGQTLHQYKGYKYYEENPALAIWEIIEKILKDCCLI